MNSKIIKNYLYNLSYQILVLLAPLITTPYISRTLGASGIGIYSYAYSIEAYFAIFAALGMQVYGQLKIASVRNNKGKLTALFYQIILAKFLTASIAVISYLAYVFFVAKENKVVAFALTMNVAATFLDISWFLQALEEFKKTVIRNYVIKLTSLALIFIFVKKESDVLKYTLILQGSMVLGNLSLWFGLKKYLVPVKVLKWGTFEHLRNSLVYFVPTLATTLYAYFDKTMIGLITHSSVQNGYYEQAYKLENISITVVSSLSVVIMPRIAYLFSSNNNSEIQKILKKSSSVMMMISVPICMGIIAVSETLVPWFLGEKFIPATPILKLFATLVVIDSIKDFYGTQILIPMKKQKFYNVIMITGVLMNLVLNYVFIIRYQALGACIASIISEIFIAVVFAVRCKSVLHFKEILGSFLKYILAGVLMGLLVYQFNKMHMRGALRIASQVISGGISYVVLLMIFRDQVILEFINKFRGRMLGRREL